MTNKDGIFPIQTTHLLFYKLAKHQSTANHYMEILTSDPNQRAVEKTSYGVSSFEQAKQHFGVCEGES